MILGFQLGRGWALLSLAAGAGFDPLLQYQAVVKREVLLGCALPGSSSVRRGRFEV